MRIGVIEHQFSDAEGRPAGGHTYGNGFAIAWQNGPLGRGKERKPPNGAFVEDVLAAVIGRIEFYQFSQFACEENAVALSHLYAAARILDERTKRREAAGVEGTHANAPPPRPTKEFAAAPSPE